MLQAIQCRNSQYLQASEIDPRLYDLLQCREGYSGPLCSSCYRPGRYVWLVQQQQQQQKGQGLTAGGYSIANASDLDLTTHQSMFDYATQPYGQASGRCSRCPHIAAAWAAFIAARLLDMLLVALMTVLWLVFAWLSESPAAAAFQKLKQGKHKQLRFRHSLESPRRLPQGLAEQLKEGKLSGLFSMRSVHSISFGRQGFGSQDPFLRSSSSYLASVSSTRAASGVSAGPTRSASPPPAAAAAAPMCSGPQPAQQGNASFAFSHPSASSSKPGSPSSHSASSSNNQLWTVGSLASPFSAPLHSVQSHASAVLLGNNRPRGVLGSVRSLASVPIAAVRQISQLDVSSSGEDAAVDGVAVEQAAQLHVAVEYLACLVQVRQAVHVAVYVKYMCMWAGGTCGRTCEVHVHVGRRYNCCACACGSGVPGMSSAGEAGGTCCSALVVHVHVGRRYMLQYICCACACGSGVPGMSSAGEADGTCCSALVVLVHGGKQYMLQYDCSVCACRQALQSVDAAVHV
jgi:hypothetical protein